MMFYTTSNSISFILARSVLLVVETGVPGENHRDLSQVPSIVHHIILYRVHECFIKV